MLGGRSPAPKLYTEPTATSMQSCKFMMSMYIFLRHSKVKNFSAGENTRRRKEKIRMPHGHESSGIKRLEICLSIFFNSSGNSAGMPKVN